MLADLDLLANGLCAAGLAGARLGEANVDSRTVRVAGYVPALLGSLPGATEYVAAVDALAPIAHEWLQTGLPTGVAFREPVQWLTRFPEVFLGTEAPGFDAIVGNPPFLGGQKITGASGVAYREHLVRHVGRDARGSADLAAYFLLSAHSLLNGRGQLGLITTNTIAQGDTREVGLDQVTAKGLDLRAAIKSQKWPTRGANLEISVIWGSRTPRRNDVPAVADGVTVPGLATTLDPIGRTTGEAQRLQQNAGRSFIGCYVLGLGFTMTPDEARDLIRADPRNAEVLFPYANGEDLNSRPDSSASRWVIDFNDWDESRARAYVLVWDRVERLVRDERQRRKPDGSYALRAPLPQRYWQYAEKRPALRQAIASLPHVLALTRVSKVVMPVRISTGQILSEQCVVIASDDFADFALLSSAPHYWWAIARSSTLETRVRYTPSDVFETLPRPSSTLAMREAGEALHEERSRFMLDRGLGLTKTYNLVHEPTCNEVDVQRLRELHVAVDLAVLAAYDWSDLPLQHDHWETRQGVRWSISPAAQVEMLDRLLALNHERHAAEEAVRPNKRPSAKMSGRPRTQDATLFDEEIL